MNFKQRPSAVSRYSTYLAWLAQSGYSRDLTAST